MRIIITCEYHGVCDETARARCQKAIIHVARELYQPGNLHYYEGMVARGSGSFGTVDNKINVTLETIHGG